MKRADTTCYDAIAAAVFVLEPDALNRPCYVGMNRFAETHGKKSPADYLGRTAVELYGGRFGTTAYTNHLTALSTRKTLTYELQLPITQENPWYRTTLTPQLNADGSVQRIIGCSLDISAEHKARELQTMLDTDTSEMEQFISMAAHDLRTPMRNVSSLAELLRDDFEDHGDGKIELIEMLDDMAKKATDLISDVLSHAAASSLKQTDTTFDFEELCHQMAGVLDPLHVHDITWPNLMLQGDATATQVVLRNLIDNAIKHGGKSQLTIQISVEPAENGHIAMRVCDNGKGMDNPGTALLDQGIFRVDSGYGLLGIRRLINARGGAICVGDGLHGGGTGITFSLPGSVLGPAPAPVNADKDSIRA